MQRYLTRFGLLLVAGAAANLAVVAVLLFVTNPYLPQRARMLDPSDALVPRYIAESWPYCTAAMHNSIALGVESLELAVVSKADHAAAMPLNPRQGPPRLIITRVRYGLPLRSLYYDQIGIAGASRTAWAELDDAYARAGLRTGIRLGRWAGGGGLPKYFPTAVLLPGFVANSAAIAATGWLVAFGPAITRRWLRRRRGQCVACGYPIGPSGVCPECGAATPSSPVVS